MINVIEEIVIDNKFCILVGLIKAKSAELRIIEVTTLKTLRIINLFKYIPTCIKVVDKKLIQPTVPFICIFFL